MLARIPRCAFCRREMKETALGRIENPRCHGCLKARLQNASQRIGRVRWEFRGAYLHPMKEL